MKLIPECISTDNKHEDARAISVDCDGDAVSALRCLGGSSYLPEIRLGKGAQCENQNDQRSQPEFATLQPPSTESAQLEQKEAKLIDNMLLR